MSLRLKQWRRPTSRTVEVLPPSAGDEATWVTLTAGFIVLFVVYLITFERDGPGGASSRSDAISQTLLPYQVFFKDLAGPEQRVFREMQEGATEALTLRGSAGAWPGVKALATDGIPPFAVDPFDTFGLRWELKQEAPANALIFEYVGMPSAVDAGTAFLLLITEPDTRNGEQAAATREDEEHRRLPGGVLLHITFWKHAASGLGDDFIREPALRGWQQIRIRGPFEEMKEQEERK